MRLGFGALHYELRTMLVKVAAGATNKHLRASSCGIELMVYGIIR